MALGWVFAVGGGVRVRVHWDGQGVMQGGQNESGWVGIGESLTPSHHGSFGPVNVAFAQKMYGGPQQKASVAKFGLVQSRY